MSRTGVFIGLLAGIAVVAVLILSGNDPFLGMNAGFVGLIINSLITLGISLGAKPKESLL